MLPSGITIDPQIMLGKPTITGTRLTVELLLEHLAAGRTVEDLLADYPRLTHEGIQAALTYAAGLVEAEAARRAGAGSQSQQGSALP